MLTRREFLFIPLLPVMQEVKKEQTTIRPPGSSPSLSINYRSSPMQITYEDVDNNIHEELTITVHEIFQVIKLLKSYVS